MDGIAKAERTQVLVYCPHCGQQVDISEVLETLQQMAKPAGVIVQQTSQVWPADTTTVTDPRMVKLL